MAWLARHGPTLSSKQDANQAWRLPIATPLAKLSRYQPRVTDTINGRFLVNLTHPFSLVRPCWNSDYPQPLLPNWVAGWRWFFHRRASMQMSWCQIGSPPALRGVGWYASMQISWYRDPTFPEIPCDPGVRKRGVHCEFHPPDAMQPFCQMDSTEMFVFILDTRA